MLPLAALPASCIEKLRGVVFDLDDTFLDGGRLSVEAYGALCELHLAGYEIFVATGRPAGWGEVLARQWPVAGVLSENGAAAAFVDESGRLRRVDWANDEERAERRCRLEELVSDVRSRYPSLVPADDVGARISDYTFDVGEHQRAEAELVDAVCSLAHARGARTTRSSVHLHLSYDKDDKATGALRLIHERTRMDRTLARFRFVYVGDSDNDAPCFAAFEVSVGVANLSGRPSMLPRYQTKAPRALGFVEVAKALLEPKKRVVR